MYRVLMPVDRNEERALAQARHVAALPEASDAVEVTVLYVFEDEDSLGPGNDESARQPEDIEAVAGVIAFFDEQGVAWRTLKDRGAPAGAILAQADEMDADAVVLGGRKRSAVGNVLFGSVTMAVMRNTDIPVVVAGHAARD